MREGWHVRQTVKVESNDKSPTPAAFVARRQSDEDGPCDLSRSDWPQILVGRPSCLQGLQAQSSTRWFS